MTVQTKADIIARVGSPTIAALKVMSFGDNDASSTLTEGGIQGLRVRNTGNLTPQRSSQLDLGGELHRFSTRVPGGDAASGNSAHGGNKSSIALASSAFATAQDEPFRLPNNATPTGDYVVNATDPSISNAAVWLQELSAASEKLILNASQATLTLNADDLTTSGETQQVAGISQINTNPVAYDRSGGDVGQINTNLSNIGMTVSAQPTDLSRTGINRVFGVYEASLGSAGMNADDGGQDGGEGGNVDVVTLSLTNSDIDVTTNINASGGGVYLEQSGGAGGTGETHASGGTGGYALGASLTMQDSSITVTADNGAVSGIVVSVSSGNGGSSKDTGMLTQGLSNGGDGGGNNGLTLTLLQGSGQGNSISTTGNNALGILARVTAGNGMKGGDRGGGLSIDAAAGDGGAGGYIGSSGHPNIAIRSTGVLTITTDGDNSGGIKAISTSGSGGDGGNVQDLSDGTAGKGADGGDNSGIEITLKGNTSAGSTGNATGGANITTKGDNSSALYALSVGGKGGTSGGSAGNASDATTYNGANGGRGGAVSVTLDDTTSLSTSGSASDGVTAQSVGGAGGNAGDATAGLGWASSGSGGNGGVSDGVSIDSAATITTKGETSRGILAQAISGIGGSGGNAGAFLHTEAGGPGTGGAVAAITVTQSGTITTSGNYSQGILAQSVSGGGGVGGSASGSLFYDGSGTAAENSSGGDITLSNTGSITTYGDSSAGIVMQSIGGGGGDGGPAGGMLHVNAGDSGNGGAGGTLTSETLSGSVTTYGTLSHGIVAQSIGGGGGSGGNSTAAGVGGTYAIGGSGGTGGNGGNITIDSDSLTVMTTGTGAMGLVAQSVGGGGGVGGSAYATTVTPALSFAFAVGGSGGGGGAGGNVEATLSGANITTSGNPDTNTNGNTSARPVDAHGVLVQSVGGGGGAGGGASAIAYAINLPLPPDIPNFSLSSASSLGGSGGSGGNGNEASLTLLDGTSVTTSGDGANGVQVQSVGGGGGQGGDSSSLAASIGFDSFGFKQFTSKTVDLSLAVGGWCDSSISGNKCAGGNGGEATFTMGDASTSASVTTSGAEAVGVMVQSIGGGGGNAGIGNATAKSQSVGTTYSAAINVGSKGGHGGVGGAASATINNGSLVSTIGESAEAVLVQSIGGGGGVGSGGGVSLGGLLNWTANIKPPAGSSGPSTDVATFAFTPTFKMGATGGTGGNGGIVTVVNNGGTITTAGIDSPGMLAQSIGGGGGVGGSGGAVPSEDKSATDSTLALIGGSDDPPPNSIPFTLSFQTTLSVGGSGGSGGDGGIVDVTHQGRITTSQDYSPGIIAQSIGAGGGKVGASMKDAETGSPLWKVSGFKATSNTTIGANLGHSGDGGRSAKVTVTLEDGSIQTGSSTTSGANAGFSSFGVLGQSIGGGGGNALIATGDSDGAFTLGATLNQGYQGSAGDQSGSEVRLANPTAESITTKITTLGDSASGVFMQSIGGGGGIGAAGLSSVGPIAGSDRSIGIKLGSTITANLIADATALGSNNVEINFEENVMAIISTAGRGAYGLAAQSVGGGGGMVNVTPGTVIDVQQLGQSNNQQTAFGNGAQVNVFVQGPDSTISTTGAGAHAVLGQSVGGGGGIVTSYSATDATPVITSDSAIKSFGTGSGGAVAIKTFGTKITTTGVGAYGVLAQSIGGGGGLIINGSNVFAGTTGQNNLAAAGSVTVQSDNVISAQGENSVGIFAQSAAPGGGGQIIVNLNGENETTGGSGALGAGVQIVGGNGSNTITIAETAKLSALSGNAVLTADGTATLNNSGTLTGSTYLSGGTLGVAPSAVINADQIRTRAVAPASSSAGMLINSGSLIPTPGQRSRIDAHLVQTSTGRIVPHLDYSNGRSGHYEVTGNAALAGTIEPTLASALPNTFLPVLTINGVQTGALAAPDSPLFSYTLRKNGGQHDIAITGTHFNEPRQGLNEHKGRIAHALENVFAAGNAEIGPFFAGLDAAARADAGSYAEAIGELSPRSTMTLFARAAADASRIADASMSCPQFADNPSQWKAFLTEGECAYFTTRGQVASLDGDADRGSSRLKSLAWQGGAQKEIRPGVLLGGSLAYQSDWFSGRDDVSATGSTVQGAVTLKRQSGQLLLTGALFGSYGKYDIERGITAPGFSAVAKSDAPYYSVGARARAAYTIGSDKLYVRPYLNLDLVHARNSAFDEGEAGDLGLSVEGARYSTAILTPAVEVGGRHELSSGAVLRSFVSAGVGVRSNDDWQGRAAFQGGEGAPSFSLNAPIDQVTMRLGAGLQLHQGEKFSVRVQYEGEFGSEATSHGATASLSYRF